MKKQEIGELCCKIFSMYTFIAAVSDSEGALLSLVAFQTAARRAVAPFPCVVVFFPSVLLCCLSACFWLYAEDIARRMFPDKDEPAGTSSSLPSNSDALKRIALAIAGILILNSAVSSLINPISSILAVPRQFTIYSKTDSVAAVIRIVLGTWLILGTRRLHSLANRLRNLTKKDW